MELDLYCETCEELICRDCIIKLHRNHDYDLVEEVYPKHEAEILEALEPVKEQLVSVHKFLENLHLQQNQINQQGEAMKDKIRANIQKLQDSLTAKGEELKAQVQRKAQEELQELAAQRDQLEWQRALLESYRDYLKESLEEADDEDSYDY